MKLALAMVAVCDDLRQEVGNKLTLVGLYGSRIVFPPGHGPFGLAKLAALVRVTGLAGVREVQAQTFYRVGDDPEKVSAVIATTRTEPEVDEHSFGLHMSPIVFQRSCVLAVGVRIRDGNEFVTLGSSIDVLRYGEPLVPARSI
jgi:hypothetical protein